MANKKIWWGMLVITFIFGGILTSCRTTGQKREAIPQTAVSIQRVRVNAGFFSTTKEEASLETPMKIFIDNKETLELDNGALTTILVNNGEHIIYAVLEDWESKSVRFTAKSQTISIFVTTKKSVLGKITLEIEVK
jgi:hypothetical protein